MTEQLITDLRRELEKARHALIDAQSHLSAHAHMNAALHCATEVFYSPLHAKVTASIAGIDHALTRSAERPVTPDHADRNCPWVQMLSDLDRCQHGRHQGDACGPADDCTSMSAGNPHLRPGAVIGYTMRRAPIVMPDRDHKHDLAAWHAATEEPTQ